jgi:hypothetical protein
VTTTTTAVVRTEIPRTGAALAGIAGVSVLLLLLGGALLRSSRHAATDDTSG